MKEIKNIRSEVYLSTYDNSDLLLQVSEEHKGIENICVAVKFGNTIIKISSKDTCKCSWHDAIKYHSDKLMHPSHWMMVGSVYYEVNKALEILGHERLIDAWSDCQENHPLYSRNYAWRYSGVLSTLHLYGKDSIFCIRPTLVFQL